MKDGVIIEEGSIDYIMNKYKSRSSHITVRLANPCSDTAAAMRMLPSADSSEYNESSGVVTIGAQDVGVLYDELISLIADRKIKVSELIAQKTTLEDVYFAITGLKGAGR
jgi:squalene cyclase